MRLLLCLSILLLSFACKAQIDSSDLALIKQKDSIASKKLYKRPYSNLNKSKWQTYSPINLTFSSLMFFLSKRSFLPSKCQLLIYPFMQ